MPVVGLKPAPWPALRNKRLRTPQSENASSKRKYYVNPSRRSRKRRCPQSALARRLPLRLLARVPRENTGLATPSPRPMKWPPMPRPRLLTQAHLWQLVSPLPGGGRQRLIEVRVNVANFAFFSYPVFSPHLTSHSPYLFIL